MIPEGWRKLEVSDLCKLQNGNSFKPHQWDTQGLPIIRIQNLNGSENFNYFSGEVEQKWLVETGQLLFSWAGTKGVSFGPFVWEKERGVLNQHIYKVHENENISKNWLYSALKWITNRIEAQAHGFKATLLHVQKKDIDSQSILVPPVFEQERIAQILSTWDKAISAKQALINNSQQQKKALMQVLFSGKRRLPSQSGIAFVGEWNTGLVADVAKVTSGGTPSRSESKFWDGDIPWVTTAEVKFSVIVKTEQYITKEGLNNSSAKLFPKGTILIAMYGQGKTRGQVAKLGIEASTNQACAALLFKEEMNADFYFHYLMSQYETIRDLSNSGGQKNLSARIIKAIPVPIPCLKEQQKIAAVLTNADKEIQLLQQQLADLKQEKKALMQQLLTGKRRVSLNKDKAA